MKKICYVYIGTYTSGKSKGIYAFDMNIETGELDQIATSSQITNPSYMAISSDKKFLYSVAETESLDHKKSGAVTSYTIDPKTGVLTFLSIQLSGSRAPCHVNTSIDGSYVFAANYREGTVSVFPTTSDGKIKEASCVIKHKGTGPVKERQEQAHAHYVSLSPKEDKLLVVDLGADKIFVYDFNKDSGLITPDPNGNVKISPGSGPRHLVFHPKKLFIYLVNELSSDIVSFDYSSYIFKKIQTIKTLPEDYIELSYCAAIHISPDGDHLYASNRGHDSIAVFSIGNDGLLELCGHTSTNGSYPRDFAIDPSGRFLYAANQYSSNIVLFEIDQENGIPSPTGYTVDVPDPVCIKYVIFDMFENL